MATNATWTVVFDDKLIIKQTGNNAGTGYVIDDDAFWSESKFSNIWAIQYQTSVTTDEVEYRNETPNGTYADANLGDFQQFIDLWDAAHLAQLQSDWDNDNIEGESEADKIARLGPRPTS
jgi:hypothetical protein|tara:strand:+ start:275 stop:634 length:360 start_codon:yes stop_codon:yes gene_type:complete